MKRAKANIWNLLLMFVHANLGRDFLNKFRALKTLLLKQICHKFQFIFSWLQRDLNVLDTLGLHWVEGKKTNCENGKF